MSDRVVYGIHAVTELLRRRRDDIAALLVQKGTDEPPSGPGRSPQQKGMNEPSGKPSRSPQTGLLGLRSEAQRLGLSLLERSRGELDRIAGGGVHQGVVALCGEYPYAPLSAVLQAAEGVAPLVLILDGVTDPQNLGALVRSALVLSAQGVVIPQDRAAPVTAAVVKAAAGATELIPIVRVPNLVRAMNELKEAGLFLVAAVAGQREPAPWALDLRKPTGLVLGSEGKGLRPLVRKTCDQRIEIPLCPGLHGASLNVAAAGAILLYEAMRQRQPPA